MDKRFENLHVDRSWVDAPQIRVRPASTQPSTVASVPTITRSWGYPHCHLTDNAYVGLVPA